MTNRHCTGLRIVAREDVLKVGRVTTTRLRGGGRGPWHVSY